MRLPTLPSREFDGLVVALALACWLPQGNTAPVSARNSAAEAAVSDVKRGQAVHDYFTRVLDNRPVEVPVARKPIVPMAAGASPIADALVDGSQPWIWCWGVNARLNGRVALSLVSGVRQPTLLWKAALAPAMSPAALLTSSQRVVVLGSGQWVSFAAGGERIASQAVGNSEVELDERAERILAGGMDGEIHQWRLADGASVLRASPYFTRNHMRTRLVTRGTRLVLVSQKLDPDVHAEPMRKSMIEVIDLSRAPKPGVLQTRIRDSDVFLSVVTDTKILLATEDRLYFLDFDLQFVDAWAGEFVPLGVSLDERDEVYLQVRIGRVVETWKLNSNAGLLWRVAVPAEVALILQPPVVGFDHHVYLVSERAVLALDADGRTLWRHSAGSPIRGAVATADRRLLVTEGSQVVAFDAAGRGELVFDAAESLTTPPALVPGGVLYVASGSHLYAVQLARQ